MTYFRRKKTIGIVISFSALALAIIAVLLFLFLYILPNIHTCELHLLEAIQENAVREAEHWLRWIEISKASFLLIASKVIKALELSVFFITLLVVKGMTQKQTLKYLLISFSFAIPIICIMPFINEPDIKALQQLMIICSLECVVMIIYMFFLLIKAPVKPTAKYYWIR